jgi:hypothetical protein
MRNLLYALALWALSAPAHAEVYKCDVNGKTVYTGEAGPGCQPQSLKVAPFDPAEAARTEEALRQMDERNKGFQEAEDRARKEREEQAQRREAAAAAAAARRPTGRRIYPQVPVGRDDVPFVPVP